jgi:DNA-binding transcriptional ArsR family regulator
MSDRRKLTSEQDLEQLTNVFKLLSDRTRLHILILLSDGERNVSSLCDELNLPQPTVSHHLGLLRTSNLIENRRAGKQVFYSLNGRVDLGDRKSLQILVGRYRIGIIPAEQAVALTAD